MQRTDDARELDQDLGGERSNGRREPAVSEVFGERYSAERAALADVYPHAGQATLEENGQPLAGQGMERMRDHERV